MIVGPQQGRFYEDFEVGDVYQHPLGRTISEADNTWFTLLTMNTNQSHFNAHYSEQTPFGKIIVNSGLQLRLCSVKRFLISARMPLPTSK